MMKDIASRRLVLRTSLGVAAAAGLGAVSTAVASPAAGGSKYPDVPGMLGDRKANEFWYQFNVATLFETSPELAAAYEAIANHLESNGKVNLVPVWLEMSKASDYPHNYASFVRPVREPLKVISRTQLGVFDRCYRRRSPGLVKAFALFGQGVLYDPRQLAPEPPVHTMNYLGAYHAWHAYLRAMMLLDVDQEQWREIDPLIAFAWAVQAVAKPNLFKVNPPLPTRTIRELAASWLPRSPRRLDLDFQSFPAPGNAG